jgi:hypothetical protein
MVKELRIQNLQFLKKSRKREKPGDIFCLKILPDAYHFGRVICVDAIGGGFEKTKLLYFYSNTSLTCSEIPVLSKDELIIPPVTMDSSGWLDGYFMTLKNEPLREEDALDIHCFWSDTHKKHFNEYWEPLARRYEPCGTSGFMNIHYIDWTLSEVLGLPYESSKLEDSIDDYDGYIVLPRDTVNEQTVTVSIRLGPEPVGVQEQPGRDEIEDRLEDEFHPGKLAEHYASGTFAAYCHMDYDVAPGQYPEVYRIIEQVLSEFNVTNYRILVVEAED